MAENKQMNSRIQHKIDTAENWEKATGFTPLKGELIIYSDSNKIKIGDGETNVNDLPFICTFSTIQEDPASGTIELQGLVLDLQAQEANISLLSAFQIKATGIKNGIYEDVSNAEIVDYFLVQEHEEGFNSEDGTPETKYSHSLYFDGNAEITGTLKATEIEGYATTQYVDDKLAGLDFSEGSTVIGSGAASGESSVVIGEGNAYGDNSIVLGSGTAYGNSSVAIGNTSSGCKGFYFSDVINDNGNYYFILSTSQNEAAWDEEAEATLEQWSDGDVISYTNGTRYVLKSTIISIDLQDAPAGRGPHIYVDAFPSDDFTKYEPEEGEIISYTEYSILNPRKPDAGIVAFAEGSFSAGINNSAAGTASIALGQDNLSAGEWSYTEGIQNTAIGTASHAEGYNTIAGNGYSHTEGYSTQALGSRGAHAEGWETQAIGNASHAEGRQTEASGLYAHAEGRVSHATALGSHAEGHETIASGEDSHAEGENSKAMEKCAHAEGGGTTASGIYAHAEGLNTNAGNTAAHAEGFETNANGLYAHAEGRQTIAENSNSHAEGLGTEARGYTSHAEGSYTVATANNQHVQGRYNYLDLNESAGSYAHIVGNGTSNESRSNAHTLDWNGNAWYAGKVYISEGSTSQYQLAPIKDIISNNSVWSTEKTIRNTYPKTNIMTESIGEIIHFTPDWFELPVEFTSNGNGDIYLNASENLLGFTDTNISNNGTVINGITYTFMPNGKVHAKGTSTGRATRIIGKVTLPPGTYTYWVDGANSDIWGQLHIDGNSEEQAKKENPYTFTLTEDTTMAVRVILRASGITIDTDLGFSITRGNSAPTTFKKHEGQIINIDNDSIEIEPYKGTNYAYIIPSTNTLGISMYHNIQSAVSKAKSLPNIYSGTTEPDASLGQIGDIYIMVGE